MVILFDRGQTVFQFIDFSSFENLIEIKTIFIWNLASKSFTTFSLPCVEVFRYQPVEFFNNF